MSHQCTCGGLYATKYDLDRHPATTKHCRDCGSVLVGVGDALKERCGTCERKQSA